MDESLGLSIEGKTETPDAHLLEVHVRRPPTFNCNTGKFPHKDDLNLRTVQVLRILFPQRNFWKSMTKVTTFLIQVIERPDWGLINRTLTYLQH